uniref:Uncharacterized protein n=1 Tax=Hucho hucho TaxID=62062 RepID=A0A4W5JKC1_9TELE
MLTHCIHSSSVVSLPAGFNTLDAARVFRKLMERSLINTNMAQMKPLCRHSVLPVVGAAEWSFHFPVFMKFTLDYLLTNTMIYWTTGSTMRFYKENLKTNIENRLDKDVCPQEEGVQYVPTGLATFLNEIMHVPQPWAGFRKIYSYFPRGSHFAALKEAWLLADDLLQFVRKVEKL